MNDNPGPNRAPILAVTIIACALLCVGGAALWLARGASASEHTSLALLISGVGSLLLGVSLLFLAFNLRQRSTGRAPRAERPNAR